MGLRILVTGSSGFIGKALVSALVAAGHTVRAAARSPSSVANESINLPDITRPVNWQPFTAEMDVAVHLAGIAHRQGGGSIDYDQANRLAVADLAASCKREGVKRLVFMSSIGALTGSASDRVLTETDEPRPVTGYDRAKLAAEEAVRAIAIDHTILRPVVVYGPNPKANVGMLLKLAQAPLPLPFGAFLNRRSLLALDNLVEAVLLSLNGDATLNQTFNVSDQAPVTLAEMFSVLRRADGRSPHLVPVPPWIFKALFKATGRSLIWDRIGRDLIIDPQKLRDAGWQPRLTTEQGLTAMVRATRQRLA